MSSASFAICEVKLSIIGGFPSQRASNAVSVSMHDVIMITTKAARAAKIAIGIPRPVYSKFRLQIF